MVWVYQIVRGAKTAICNIKQANFCALGRCQQKEMRASSKCEADLWLRKWKLRRRKLYFRIRFFSANVPVREGQVSTDVYRDGMESLSQKTVENVAENCTSEQKTVETWQRIVHRGCRRNQCIWRKRCCWGSSSVACSVSEIQATSGCGMAEKGMPLSKAAQHCSSTYT